MAVYMFTINMYTETKCGEWKNLSGLYCRTQISV